MNELIRLESVNAVELFTDTKKMSELLNNLEVEVKKILLDPSTLAGRKEIASVAHKIAKTKTAIDNLGKAEAAEWKAKAKGVDTIRSMAWDRLEALQHEIRKPLTEFEEREEKRCEDHENAIADIKRVSETLYANWLTNSLDTMQKERDQINLLSDRKWEEFKERADQEISAALAKIDSAMAQKRKYDEDQARLKQLEEETAARAKADREAEIARQAAEKAKADAEEVARKEAEAKQREIDEANRKALEAKAAADKAEADRIAAEKKAEEDRVAAEKKAADDAAAAAKKAEDDKQAAIEAERKRVADEEAAQKAADEKRAADKAHRDKTKGDAIDAVAKAIDGMECGPIEVAHIIIDAIDSGTIPNVTIKY